MVLNGAVGPLNGRQKNRQNGIDRIGLDPRWRRLAENSQLRRWQKWTFVQIEFFRIGSVALTGADGLVWD